MDVKVVFCQAAYWISSILVVCNYNLCFNNCSMLFLIEYYSTSDVLMRFCAVTYFSISSTLTWMFLIGGQGCCYCQAALSCLTSAFLCVPLLELVQPLNNQSFIVNFSKQLIVAVILSLIVSVGVIFHLDIIWSDSSEQSSNQVKIPFTHCL